MITICFQLQKECTTKQYAVRTFGSDVFISMGLGLYVCMHFKKLIKWYP